MTLLAPTAPLITVPHDWTEPPQRETTVPAAVLTAEDGTEQRLGLSAAPSVVMTYRLLTPTFGDAAGLKTLLDAAVDGLVRVPRWEDQAWIAAPGVSAGASSIPCDPSDKPTFVAGCEVLLWRSQTQYEVAVIGSVGGGSVETVDPLAADWPEGTKIVPISEARVVRPLTLTHWRVTSGALSIAFEVGLRDLAGLGAGGAVVTATVASISLAWRTQTNLLGRTGRGVLAAQAFDAAGDPLTGVPIVWTSADPDAAVWPTVDPMVAVVEGRRTAGPFPNNVDITATVGSVSATKTITCWS